MLTIFSYAHACRYTFPFLQQQVYTIYTHNICIVTLVSLSLSLYMCLLQTSVHRPPLKAAPDPLASLPGDLSPRPPTSACAAKLAAAAACWTRDGLGAAARLIALCVYIYIYTYCIVSCISMCYTSSFIILSFFMYYTSTYYIYKYVRPS